jgi:DNA-binding response OmpR family regulator/HPt (histidine-containing phosphotransfer) domain-containing protein
MKILLIEDDPHTSELLAATLTAHHYAVDAIADGAAGLELATQWSYDLILLDVLLPTLDGIEVCRRLRAQNCQTPVLILTVKDANEDIIAGLDAGADDYIAKSCDSAQLLARVRALLRRSGMTSLSPVLTWGLLRLDPALAQVTYGQAAIALRPKEYNLLELFLRYPQRIFSRSAIIDHLWSIDDTPVEGSVTNLIKDLRHRLKSAGMNDDLIETVYGLGYRLKALPAERGEEKGAGRGERSGGKALAPPVSVPGDWANDWAIREQRGKSAIQQIAERFRGSIEQRIAVLEATERSLHAGCLTLPQRKAARTEAHKLAGGLGTFGYGRVSEIAAALERLLEPHRRQDAPLADQFTHLLAQLKRELFEESVHGITVESSFTRSSFTESSFARQ